MKIKSRAIVFKKVLYLKMKGTCICLGNLKLINDTQITGTGNWAAGVLKENLTLCLLVVLSHITQRRIWKSSLRQSTRSFCLIHMPEMDAMSLNDIQTTNEWAVLSHRGQSPLRKTAPRGEGPSSRDSPSSSAALAHISFSFSYLVASCSIPH